MESDARTQKRSDLKHLQVHYSLYALLSTYNTVNYNTRKGYTPFYIASCVLYGDVDPLPDRFEIHRVLRALREARCGSPNARHGKGQDSEALGGRGCITHGNGWRHVQ